MFGLVRRATYCLTCYLQTSTAVKRWMLSVDSYHACHASTVSWTIRRTSTVTPLSTTQRHHYVVFETFLWLVSPLIKVRVYGCRFFCNSSRSAIRATEGRYGKLSYSCRNVGLGFGSGHKQRRGGRSTYVRQSSLINPEGRTGARLLQSRRLALIYVHLSYNLSADFSTCYV